MSGISEDVILTGGDLQLDSLPKPPSRVVKVYLAATTTDSITERNCLVEKVYPTLREYCRNQYGLEFQVLDLRWGSNEDWSDISLSRELARHTITECQRKSAGPNFVAIVGQKYGPAPLPSSMLATEFDLVTSTLRRHRNRETRDVALLDCWYELDNNAVPPRYVLVEQRKGAVAQQRMEMRTSVVKNAAPMPVVWEESKAALKRLLSKGLNFCILEGSMSEAQTRDYSRADLEMEIQLGALQAEDPDSTCLVLVRNIVDLKNYINHPTIGDYMVTSYNDIDDKIIVDEESEERQQYLQETLLKKYIPRDNLHEFDVLWKHDDGIHPSTHQNYLDEMCNTFKERMTKLIDRVAHTQTEGQLDPLVAEVLQHWNMVREKTKIFIGRTDIVEILRRYVVSNDRMPLVLHGDSGSGKTATMAMAAAKTSEWLSRTSSDVVTVVRFLGTTTSSHDICQLLKSICCQIAVVCKEDRAQVPSNFNELQNFFFNQLENFPENRSLVIYLDALHELVSQYDAHLLDWMPQQLKENVKFIVSVVPTATTMDRLTSEIIHNPQNFVELPPMEVTECVELLHLLLTQDSRTVSPVQERAVVQIFQQCSYPIFVHLLYTYARLWSSSTPLDPSMLPGSITDGIDTLFDYLEQKYGHNLASKTLAYITASTTGISACELEDLLSLDEDVLNEVYNNQDVGTLPPVVRRIPPMAYVAILDEIKDFLSERDCEGFTVLYWNHRLFIDAAKERYLHDGNERKQVHSLLADYYLGSWHSVPKPFKMAANSNNNNAVVCAADRLVPAQPLTFLTTDGKEHFNKRKYEQVPRHLYLAGRLTELSQIVLFSYEWLYNKTKALSLEHVLSDFVLNPGVEATLVEKALRDAQGFIEQDINTMNAEITGRLLCYYLTHTNIRKLINECDASGLKRNALLPNFPYSQVPGSPLKFSLECSTAPAQFGLVDQKGRILLAKSASKSLIDVFDLATGETLSQVHGSTGEMQISPNGKFLAIVDHVSRMSVKIHAVSTGQFLGQLIPANHIRVKPKNKYEMPHVCVSNNHVVMVVSVEQSYLCIADLHTCTFKQVIGLQDGKRCTMCAITPDGRYVFLNSGTTLLSYDLFDLQQKSASSLEYAPTTVCFNTSGSKGFMLNKDENKVYVLDIGNGAVEFIYKVVVTEPFENDQVVAVTMSSKQDMVLIRGRDNLLVYHIASEKVIAHITRPIDVPTEFKLPRSTYEDIIFTQASFSPDDKFIIATIFRNIYIWNIANNQLLTTLQAPVGIIDSLVIPPDRGQVVTHQKGSKLIHVWSLGDAIGSVGMMDSLTSAVEEMLVTKNDKTAFIRCQSSDEIGILDVTSGQLADLMTHETPVTGFTITQDGEYMIVTVKGGKSGTVNKIWHTPNRKIIYEFGDSAVHSVALQEENVIMCVEQDSKEYKAPYRVRQFKFNAGTFDEYHFDNEIKFVLAKPFVTPEDKYLVILSADDYDDKNAMHINPTICAISLQQSKASINTFSARELAERVEMRRILHIRPYKNNSYTVIVLFTNEPDMSDDGRSSRVYDHCYHFMIFDVCSGVVCQVIDDFMAPSTPIDRVLFPSDVRFCLDHMSNLFDMGTGYFIKCLHEDEPCPRALALDGKVAVYYSGTVLWAIRIEDCKTIANLDTHGKISSIKVCHDERTILLGCEDGAIKSFVLIDVTNEDSSTFLKLIPSRRLPETSSSTIPPQTAAIKSRSWDRVAVGNGVVAPPYSRPPSASVVGVSDRELLTSVRPLPRTRPYSDTAIDGQSRACEIM